MHFKCTIFNLSTRASVHAVYLCVNKYIMEYLTIRRHSYFFDKMCVALKFTQKFFPEQTSQTFTTTNCSGNFSCKIL